MQFNRASACFYSAFATSLVIAVAFGRPLKAAIIVAAAPTDDALVAYAHSNWHIGASDPAIRATFNAKRYGIDYKVWLSAFIGMQDSVAAYNRQDYPSAWSSGTQTLTTTVLQELVDKKLQASELAGWASGALDIGLNFYLLTLEVDAYAYQEKLYFSARPYNSAAQIAQLQPFDLLDGVDLTKEGNGWLFDVSTYLRPFPSNMSAATFWPLAESAWTVHGLNSAEIARENTDFSAAFAAAIAATPEPTGLAVLVVLPIVFARRRRSRM